jgi:hypothetical protein
MQYLTTLTRLVEEITLLSLAGMIGTGSFFVEKEISRSISLLFDDPTRRYKDV